MKTEAFLAVLFVWAVIDGDYAEASLIALRWIAMAWRALAAMDRRLKNVEAA